MTNSKFPIPMRGNEEYQSTPSPAPRRPGEFPIPMRGNEVCGGSGGFGCGCKFPIPMRGNEEAEGKLVPGTGVTVSDPHEG